MLLSPGIKSFPKNSKINKISTYKCYNINSGFSVSFNKSYTNVLFFLSSTILFIFPWLYNSRLSYNISLNLPISFLI